MEFERFPKKLQASGRTCLSGKCMYILCFKGDFFTVLPAFTGSKSTMEIAEQCVESVQSEQ